jgi:hypothetical protein
MAFLLKIINRKIKPRRGEIFIEKKIVSPLRGSVALQCGVITIISTLRVCYIKGIGATSIEV